MRMRGVCLESRELRYYLKKQPSRSYFLSVLILINVACFEITFLSIKSFLDAD